MKKLIALLMAISMVLCFAACGDGETDPTGTQSSTQGSNNGADEFFFEYNGVKITLNASAEPIVEALGEPTKYSESTSCAFEGLDKTYSYPSFHLETYPKDGKDFIYGWWFVDDMVETPEGICIGTAQADVEAAYGTDGFNGTNAYTVKRGSGVLTIILKDGAVDSIQYALVVD